jgi:DNA polymerase-1
MKTYTFDIESDGLLDTITKIHCLVLRDVETNEVLDFSDEKYGKGSIEKGVRLLMGAKRIIGHNSIKFDIPAIQKLYPWFEPRWVVTEDDVRSGYGAIDTLTCVRLMWSDIAGGDEARVRVGQMPGKLMGSHGLEAWGYRLKLHKGDYSKDRKAEAQALGMTEDRDIFEFTWGTWNQEMHDYCILDTEVTLELWKRITRKAYSAEAVWLEHRFAYIIAMQERYGFGFDRDAAVKLYSLLVARRLELKEELERVFPGRFELVEERTIKRTVRRFIQSPQGAEVRLVKPPRKTGRLPYEERGYYSLEEEGSTFSRIEWVEFNPSSRHHIAKRLQEKGWHPLEFTDSGQPKISETILEALIYPEASVLAEHFLVEKRIGQLAEGDQAWLRLEKLSVIHGSVNTNGAVTGRCTHSNPNIAQCPKVGSPYGAECRALFIARLGRLVGADLAGLELRCLAHFMARYDNGEYGRILLEGDIHWANVKALGLTDEERNDDNPIHKLFRNAAKTFIYAFLYGAGDLKIGQTIYELVIIDARKKGINSWGELQQHFFGTDTTEQLTEAQLSKAGKRLKQTFMRKTPALKALKEAVTQAAAKGTINGIDGRILSIRSAHAALNTLLQSAGALIAKLATVFAYDELCTRGYVFGKDWALVAHVHDEMQADSKVEIADEVGTVLVDAMRRAGEHFRFRLPVDGEWKTGANWRETH